MTFFILEALKKSVVVFVLLAVNVGAFSIDGTFSQKKVRAPNGTELIFYTLVYYEENELVHPEFGHRNVSFNVSLQAVSLENPKKTVPINSINADLNQTPDSTQVEIRAALEERMNENYEAWGERFFQYSVEESIDCIFADEKIMTFCFSFYEYKGGAHGLYGSTYKNYALESGKKSGIVTDIIHDPQDEKLLTILREKLLQNDGNPHTADDFFEFEKITLSDNFFPSQNGISFFYNVYEILPYVYGATTLFFTFAELQPFVTPENPYRHLFKQQ